MDRKAQDDSCQPGPGGSPGEDAWQGRGLSVGMADSCGDLGGGRAGIASVWTVWTLNCGDV